MNNKLIIPVAAFSLMAIGAGSAAAFTTVDAAEDGSQYNQPEHIHRLSEEERKERRMYRKWIREEVERTVTNIDTGVRITFTSENTDLLTNIEERATKHHSRIQDRKDSLDVNQIITRDGNTLMVELSSDDAEVIERIQDRAEKPYRRGYFRKHGPRHDIKERLHRIHKGEHYDRWGQEGGADEA